MLHMTHIQVKDPPRKMKLNNHVHVRGPLHMMRQEETTAWKAPSAPQTLLSDTGLNTHIFFFVYLTHCFFITG